jgi:spermidine/putrescine transport system substrate-binding protein
MKTLARLRGGVLGATIVVSALALSACGGSTTDGGSSPSASTTTSASTSPSESAPATFTPSTSGELTMYTWSDYFPPAMATRFSKETGIKLTVSYYDSNETLEAKLKASSGTGYDLVVPSDYMVQNLIRENLLAPIDLAALPNGGAVKPEFLDVYFDQGRKYSVPYLYGTTGYAYDSKVITTPMATWKDYFAAPAEAAGKINIFNDQVESINAALRAVGGEPCTTDGAKLQAAQDLLVAFKSKISTISSEGNIDRMMTGENPLAMMWNGATHRVKEKKASVVYVYPTEGTSLWQDNWAIPSGAANVNQALTFLNWWMDPKNAAEAANSQGYNSGIVGVDELLNDSMKNDPAVVIPAADLPHVGPAAPCDAAATNNYSKIWEKFKAS